MQEVDRLRDAIRQIAHGNWSIVQPDSAAAYDLCHQIAEMRRIAEEALENMSILGKLKDNIETAKRREQATQLVEHIVSMSGGPLTTRDNAIDLVSDALAAAYRQGWDDKQRQLSDAMYPR